MIAEIAVTSSTTGHLRRLDMRRDLAKVADLVELCFFDTLDPEGKQYLKEMRRAAQNPSLLGWASAIADEASMPPSGYVWEEDGRLVGNLSLIPITVQGKRGYMIANVATHPDFRGRGIARMLTVTALDYARDHHAASTWLQVRDDNPIAIHIYETCGFSERLRRTSWYSGPTFEEQPVAKGIRVVKRRSDHWPMQHAWLSRTYPPLLDWHIPMDWNLFRPDIWGKLYRFFNLEVPQHWSVEKDGELEGVFTWKHSGSTIDSVWLALPEVIDEEAASILISTARKAIRRSQPLNLNYPAGYAVIPLHQTGFYPHQTLIWMEHKLTL